MNKKVLEEAVYEAVKKLLNEDGFINLKSRPVTKDACDPDDINELFTYYWDLYRQYKDYIVGDDLRLLLKSFRRLMQFQDLAYKQQTPVPGVIIDGERRILDRFIGRATLYSML